MFIFAPPSSPPQHINKFLFSVCHKRCLLFAMEQYNWNYDRDLDSVCSEEYEEFVQLIPYSDEVPRTLVQQAPIFVSQPFEPLYSFDSTGFNILEEKNEKSFSNLNGINTVTYKHNIISLQKSQKTIMLLNKWGMKITQILEILMKALHNTLKLKR